MPHIYMNKQTPNRGHEIVIFVSTYFLAPQSVVDYLRSSRVLETIFEFSCRINFLLLWWLNLNNLGWLTCTLFVSHFPTFLALPTLFWQMGDTGAKTMYCHLYTGLGRGCGWQILEKIQISEDGDGGGCGTEWVLSIWLFGGVVDFTNGPLGGIIKYVRFSQPWP